MTVSHLIVSAHSLIILLAHVVLALGIIMVSFGAFIQFMRNTYADDAIDRNSSEITRLKNRSRRLEDRIEKLENY